MLVSIQDLRSIQERCEIGELVQRLLVSRGYTFYNRKRLMVVPKSVVNEILGTEVA